MQIKTPLPASFFGSLVLDPLRQHFVSFFKLTCMLPPPRPEPPAGPKHLAGPLISWVPLKSFNCAIIVFYDPDDAEGARQASDRWMLLPANSIHARNHRLCFPSCAYDIGPRPAKQAAARSVLRHDRYDVNAIFELPFHLRPPVPERSFWISPQEAYPLAENRRTMWRPTRYASPGTSTAHSISYATNGNRWIGTGKVQEARLEIWP